MHGSQCSNAISCTHRRHERSSKKPCCKIDDDGGYSGGNGSNEASSMVAAAMVLGGASFKLHAPHRQKLSATRATTRAAVARVTWGTTTDALADAVEALWGLEPASFVRAQLLRSGPQHPFSV